MLLFRHFVHALGLFLHMCVFNILLSCATLTHMWSLRVFWDKLLWATTQTFSFCLTHTLSQSPKHTDEFLHEVRKWCNRICWGHSVVCTVTQNTHQHSEGGCVECIAGVFTVTYTHVYSIYMYVQYICISLFHVSIISEQIKVIVQMFLKWDFVKGLWISTVLPVLDSFPHWRNRVKFWPDWPTEQYQKPI